MVQGLSRSRLDLSHLFKECNAFTELKLHCRVHKIVYPAQKYKNLASYSGGPGLKSRPGGQVS
jgi:hypothetical protein